MSIDRVGTYSPWYAMDDASTPSDQPGDVTDASTDTSMGSDIASPADPSLPTAPTNSAESAPIQQGGGSQGDSVREILQLLMQVIETLLKELGVSPGSGVTANSDGTTPVPTTSPIPIAGAQASPQVSSGANGTMSSQELLSNPMALRQVGAIELNDFAQQFDVNQDGQLDPSEQQAMGRFADALSQQLGGCEVYIGVSRDASGGLRAVVTAGDQHSVVGTYPEGTPIFKGHVHPNGNLQASGTDMGSRLENGTNVVWGPDGGMNYY